MRGVRMLGSMESKVRTARQTFNCLLYRPDLNTNGWPLATQGGIPSSTIVGCPNPPDFSGQSSPGGPAAGVNALGLQYWPPAVVTLPDPQGTAPNSQANYSQPPAPVMLPLTTQQHTKQAQALTQAAAATTNPAPPIFTPQGPQGLVFVPQTNASGKTTFVLQKPTMQNDAALFTPLPGMGNWDGGSFLQGLISAVGVAAAGVYLYKYAREKGYV